MLSEEQRIEVLSVVRQHLLTRRGLRSLSPRNPFYEPSYADDQRSQDLASRNGSIWIWPLMFYVKSCFAIAGDQYLGEAEEIPGRIPRRDSVGLYRFGERVLRGRSSIPCARDACRRATSVGGLLYISDMVEHRRKRPRQGQEGQVAFGQRVRRRPCRKVLRQRQAEEGPR